MNERIEGRVIELLVELTGRTVDRAWASRIRRQILEDREVSNPLRYITAAIRGEPTRYLPAPDAQGELGAEVIATVRQADWDAHGSAAHSGAEQARRLLAAKTARKATE